MGCFRQQARKYAVYYPHIADKIIGLIHTKPLFYTTRSTFQYKTCVVKNTFCLFRFWLIS